MMQTAPVLWLTGLSGAGKSTLAQGASARLAEQGLQTIVIDGDVLRAGLNADLGFTEEDRAESVRRAAEVAALCARSGIVVFVSLVSPFATGRARAREIVGPRFHEIYVNADLKTCSNRDIKGFYALAAAGKIANFTGITSPYEVPAAADLTVDTMTRDIAACIDQVATYAWMHCRG